MRTILCIFKIFEYNVARNEIVRILSLANKCKTGIPVNLFSKIREVLFPNAKLHMYHISMKKIVFRRFWVNIFTFFVKRQFTGYICYVFVEITHNAITGYSRWMCRILYWYGDYTFRLWEILRWFLSNTDVYIW